jgi:hypothetical protein
MEKTMNMQERLMEMSAQAREQASTYAQRAARAAVDGLDRTAGQVEALRGPVGDLAAAGLELNQKSARFVEQLLQQQSQLAAALLTGGARRLRALAKAADANLGGQPTRTKGKRASKAGAGRAVRAAAPRRAARVRKAAATH